MTGLSDEMTDIAKETMAESSPAPKVSFVSAAADLGCGVGYYK